MNVRHFLSLFDCSKQELANLIQRAIDLKKRQHLHIPHQSLSGKILAMIFEKSSTRTRVSFEAGMSQLGGQAIFLSPRDTQLGRGETIHDSAIVISSMVDMVMIRTFGHDRLQEFAKNSRVPVINALTDDLHPCQLLADMQTFFERRGNIAGKTVAWIGDGNNMCHSYAEAAEQFDFRLNIACPVGFEPNPKYIEAAKGRITITHDPKEAVQGAHLVSTDVFTSMGQEDEAAERLIKFKGFQVNEALLDLATSDVIFMHCLPAHRGEEVSVTLLDDPRSVVWQQAENRLHAQKALLEFLYYQS